MAETNPHILIVEDDAMIRSFLRVVLEGEGYEVTEAETGAEMFAALDGGHFEVIVLDIMLPDGNGVDFARTLRRTSTLPIVFATAVTDTDTRRHAIGLMQVDYVTKPFDAAELLLRIKNIRTMAPVMEDPNARDLPKPAIDKGIPWYQAPLIWGPALAFLIVVAGGIFLIPGDEDPAAYQAALQAQQAEQARNALPGTPGVPGAGPSAAGTARQETESGVVLRDAVPTGQAEDQFGADPTPQAGAAGTVGAAGSDEEKVILACGELPVSEFWNNNSIKRVLRYVRFVHNGDWGEYLGTWVERLKNVQDLEASGKSIELQKKDIVLSGEDLEKYVDLMERRVRFLRCASQIIQTTK